MKYISIAILVLVVLMFAQQYLLPNKYAPLTVVPPYGIDKPELNASAAASDPTGATIEQKGDELVFVTPIPYKNYLVHVTYDVPTTAMPLPAGKPHQRSVFLRKRRKRSKVTMVYVGRKSAPSRQTDKAARMLCVLA